MVSQWFKEREIDQEWRDQSFRRRDEDLHLTWQWACSTNWVVGEGKEVKDGLQVFRLGDAWQVTWDKHPDYSGGVVHVTYPSYEWESRASLLKFK